MKLGLKKVSPELPLTTLMLMVLVPAVRVPAKGGVSVYTHSKSRALQILIIPEGIEKSSAGATSIHGQKLAIYGSLIYSQTSLIPRQVPRVTLRTGWVALASMS